MKLATCPGCGTQTDAGAGCVSCGTPIPAEHGGSQETGYGSYWEGILDKLKQATAPKYEVLGILGYGGMAGVYAADEPRLGRKVAIKVMSPALMMDPKLVERFVQEARTIALLSHPNIVTIYEVDEREDLHWFTMTYVAGRTLGQVMLDAAAPLPIEVVRAWLYQIGDALAYAHANGVVHRDVKPGNVLLDLRGNALVTDFGIAKVADGEAGLTRTGMLVGTPTYMSPEQCSSGDVTGTSDQYSLGAVAYQMLTGQPPFNGPTLALLQAHLAQEPRALRSLRPECPEQLASAVHRMLAKRPDERWPTISAAVAAAGAKPPGMEDGLRQQLERLAAATATIAVTPQLDAMREGDRQRIQLHVQDATGRAITDRRVDWSSQTPAVALQSGNMLHALSPGTTRITVACGAARAAWSVTVEPDPIGDIDIKPKELSLGAGSEAPLRAAVVDLDGSRLDSRAVLWSSSDPAVAAVSPLGVVRGVRPGSAVVAARTGGKYAAAAITVNAAVVSPAAPSGGATAPERERTRVPRPPVPRPAPVRKPAAGSRRPAAGAGTSKRRRVLITAGVAATLILAATVGALMRFGPLAVEEPTGEAQTEPAVTPAPVPTPAQDASDALDQPGLAAPTEEPSATGEQTPADTEPTPAPEQPPTLPVTGSVTILGSLPPGSEINARNTAGDIWVVSGRAIVLEPAVYTFEFRAPGYDSDRQDVAVRAGETQNWQPRVRAVAVAPPPAETPPPQPAQPVRDVAADREAVTGIVREYVSAFHRRDSGTVVPLLPVDIRAGWQHVLTTRDVTDFSATLAAIGIPRVDGEMATVDFDIGVSLHNVNRPSSSVLRLTGTATRTDDTWTFISIASRP